MSVARSESIAELAKALCKAQSVMEGATKGKKNDHFKSKYADLYSVWEACRKPLSDNGLSVVQFPGGDGHTVTLTTVLMHNSGEFYEGTLSMLPTKADPQGVMSCITYMRRAGVASAVGISPEDDDGNAASEKPTVPATVAAPAGFADWLVDLESVADEGVDALKNAWTQSKPQYRKHLTATGNAKWEALKSKAATKQAAA